MRPKLKPTIYLYDVEPEVFADLPYAEALQKKKELASALLEKLLQEPLAVRDLKRVTDVYDAVRFNKNLLEEIGIQ